ncbi:MAG: hypothetical protein ACOYXT_01680 [Bacteroidota bacterium]
MKKVLWCNLIFLALVFTWSCGQKRNHDAEHNHDTSDAVESSGNQALYDEVMKIHDEVMPKMEDIHRKKEELKNKIASTPDLAAEKKAEIEAMILKLDSAGEGMMEWMRNFNPLPDSLGEEKAREYLENEMQRVKEVRENILEALEKAKTK